MEASASPADFEPTGATRPKYGIQVTVDPAVLGERELGLFRSSDLEGELSTVRVLERRHGTSAEPVEAVSYRFERSAAGTLPISWIWFLLSRVSSVLLIGLIFFDLTNPTLNLGIPLPFYYLILLSVYLPSKLLEQRKFKREIALSVAALTLNELEESYGKEPIIDLPRGRIEEIGSTIEEALMTLSLAKDSATTKQMDSTVSKGHGKRRKDRVPGKTS